MAAFIGSHFYQHTLWINLDLVRFGLNSLALWAGVNAAAQEGFFKDLRSAPGAGGAFCFRAQHHLIAAWLSQQVLFGAPPAGSSHGLEGGLDACV